MLKKINTGLSPEFWEQYYALVEKRRNEQLTPPEHAALIELSNSVEETNARRMKHLAQLARLKNMDLDDLMEKLGIAPRSHA